MKRIGEKIDHAITKKTKKVNADGNTRVRADLWHVVIRNDMNVLNLNEHKTIDGAAW